jgi:uncharacterized protein (TIGR03437 family)
MAMGPADRLFANDELSRIMRLTPEGVINTIVPRPDRAGLPDLDGPADQAALYLIEDLLVDHEGNLLVAERTGRRVRLIRNVSDCGLVKRPQIAYFGVTNAAAGASLAPGTIVSIFGAGLGPAAPAGGVLQAGRLTTEVAGVRVLVNGVAAPLLYVSDTQINAIIPYATEVAGTTTIQQNVAIFTSSRAGKLQVAYQGVLSDAKLIYPAPAAPAIFAQSSGLAAALNQDGSVNGPLHPAAPGSVIVLFATGEGLTDPPGVDGRVAGDILPRPLGPVEVTIGGEPAEVIYAGAAPGLVSGVMQVNARISPMQQNLGAVPVRLKVGDFGSQAVSVVVGQ